MHELESFQDLSVYGFWSKTGKRNSGVLLDEVHSFWFGEGALIVHPL